MSTLPTWLKEPHVNSGLAQPNWHQQLRRAQWATFAALGLPTSRHERWRYHDLSFLQKTQFETASLNQTVESHVQDSLSAYRLQHDNAILLVLIDGYCSKTLSQYASLPERTVICSKLEALSNSPELLKQFRVYTDEALQPFASLNAAQSDDGWILILPDDCQLKQPVHLISFSTHDGMIGHPQNMIMLGSRSKLKLIEEHVAIDNSDYLQNIFTTMVLKQAASLQYTKIQNESTMATHFAQTWIQQAQDSNVSMTTVSIGSQLARDAVQIDLLESGAKASVYGFYYLEKNNQCIDHHLDINHLAPSTESEMIYKGVLQEKTRSIFNGRLFVAQNAGQIIAYQANHNLLLSPTAEVYSKPELEIYAHDVQCKHGATVGQLDEDALFYLRSRGIEKEVAQRLLLRGFANEILNRISQPDVQLRVQEKVQ